MNIYQAIDRMRRLTEQRTPFSIDFCSYSMTRRKSEGILHIEHAALRSFAKESRVKLREHMLLIYDMDRCEYRHIYKPLLLALDGQPLDLSN